MLGGSAAVAGRGDRRSGLLDRLPARRPARRLSARAADRGRPGRLGPAHGARRVPDARLLQADVCALPLADASVDAAVSANLLEHVPDDAAALGRAAPRPGARRARPCSSCPPGRGTYDYYDRFLGHERRYGRGELADKARERGLEVVEDVHLGSVLLTRRSGWSSSATARRYDHLEGRRSQARVGRRHRAHARLAVGHAGLRSSSACCLNAAACICRSGSAA